MNVIVIWSKILGSLQCHHYFDTKEQAIGYLKTLPNNKDKTDSELLKWYNLIELHHFEA